MATAISGTTGVNKVTYDAIKTGMGVTGSAPIYACRAWVNFNGTGTVAIRASGNVSSITDNGPGDYTVNFTTSMSDVNYGICASIKGNDSSNNRATTCETFARTRTTSSAPILCTYGSSGTNLGDPSIVNVAIFR